MNNNYKKIVGVLALSFGMLFITGCGDIEYTPTVDEAVENGGAYKDNKVELEEKVDENNADTNEENTVSNESLGDSKPIVLSVNEVEALTDTFNDSIERFDKEIHERSGYIVSHEIKSAGNDSKKTASDRELKISVRVPKEAVEETMDYIGEEFHIVSESSSTVDVTKNYYDVNSEIEVLTTQETRLNELLNKTESVEDLIKIGDELMDVSNKKKSLKLSKEDMEYRMKFSRINLKLKEVKSIPSNGNELSAKDRIVTSLLNTIQSVKNMLVELAVFISTSLPLIILTPFIYIIYKKYKSSSEGIIEKKNIDSDENFE